MQLWHDFGVPYFSLGNTNVVPQQICPSPVLFSIPIGTVLQVFSIFGLLLASRAISEDTSILLVLSQDCYKMFEEKLTLAWSMLKCCVIIQTMCHLHDRDSMPRDELLWVNCGPVRLTSLTSCGPTYKFRIIKSFWRKSGVWTCMGQNQWFRTLLEMSV